MERPENFDAQVIIDYLQGTCMTLNDAIESYYPNCDDSILTTEDHNEIDNQIFYCEECGWWCEISEMAWENDNSDTICVDCYEAQQEEE